MLTLIAGYGGCKMLSGFFLGLIALGMGYFVCIQGKKDPENCGKCSKFFGGIIMGGAILGLLCIGLKAFRSGKDCCEGKEKGACPYHQEAVTGTDDASSAQ